MRCVLDRKLEHDIYFVNFNIEAVFSILFHQESSANNSASQLSFLSQLTLQCFVTDFFHPISLWFVLLSKESLLSCHALIWKLMTATQRRKSSNSMAELPVCQNRSEGLVHFCSEWHLDLDIWWIGKVVLKWVGPIELRKMNIFDFRDAAGYVSIVLFIAALKLWVRGSRYELRGWLLPRK